MKPRYFNVFDGVDEIKSLPDILPDDKIRELIKTYQDSTSFPEGSPERKEGIEARNRVILSNIRFVIRVTNNLGIPYLAMHEGDRISSGVLGLIDAIDAFDLNYTNTFLTYAYWHVVKSLFEWTNKSSSTISVTSQPVRREAMRFIKENKGTLSNTNDLRPAVADAVRAMSVEFLNDNDAIDNRHHEPEPELTFVQTEFLHSILDRLDKRSAQIICWRFGAFGEEKLTYSEMGDRLNLSKQRIQQIYSSAWRRLNVYARENERHEVLSMA